MNIKWTPQALADYQKALQYLDVEWGKKVRTDFINRVESVIQLIVQYPNLYPASTQSIDVRRCVITKHTILYYRHLKNTIEILALYDSRKKTQF